MGAIFFCRVANFNALGIIENGPSQPHATRKWEWEPIELDIYLFIYYLLFIIYLASSTYVSSLYVTSLYMSSLYVSSLYVSSLYVSSLYISSLYVSSLYVLLDRFDWLIYLFIYLYDWGQLVWLGIEMRMYFCTVLYIFYRTVYSTTVFCCIILHVLL